MVGATGAGAGAGTGAGAGVGAAAGGVIEEDDDDALLALPAPALLVPVGALVREPLRVPEPFEPFVFVDLPGFACATKPARAPTSAMAPTQANLVTFDARRSAASRAVPPCRVNSG